MKISEILSNGKVNISCELFPPKVGSELEGAKKVVAQMAKLSPAFMSVTCGAGGSTKDNTADIANEIQNVNNIPAIAHLTCVGADKAKIKETLTELKKMGIENIFALRGDRPQWLEGEPFVDYKHASDLMKEIVEFGDFCIGGACYPEKHPEAATLEADIEALKYKVECGCSFLTTQMFFDNNILYSYMYKLLKKGIDVPVLAGIMPITNAKQLGRSVALSGTQVPQRFRSIVDKFGDNPQAMRQAGIAYATDQIIDLIANGVTNIHIYTMNKPDIAGQIMSNLSEIINK